MHRISHVASSRLRTPGVLHRVSSGARTLSVKACSMPVTKRVVAVNGFEELGTEVWELTAISEPKVDIIIIPGNPGSAGLLFPSVVVRGAGCVWLVL